MRDCVVRTANEEPAVRGEASKGGTVYKERGGTRRTVYKMNIL
jgi:hypothetical protein